MFRLSLATAFFLLSSATGGLAAPIINPMFAGAYSVTGLGKAPGVPDDTGGLTFLAGDSNTLLIGGAANRRLAEIYSVPVVRDSGGRVTGFEGSGVFFSDAYGLTGGIDGGLVYGPGGVLFYSSYPDNHVGQIKPGSTAPDKLINLIPQTGVASSLGGLQFVPAGYPGAGRLKLTNYSVGRWYDAVVTPDGTGTFDIQIVFRSNPLGINLFGSPEGIYFVPIGSPLFPSPSVLIADFKYQEIAAYEVDGNGDPIPSTYRQFMSGLRGASGITEDPLTGDLVLSTFAFGNQLYRVSGFTSSSRDPVYAPEPGTLALFAIGSGVLWLCKRRAS